MTLADALDALSPESRETLIRFFEDLNDGPLNEAYHDLAELIGRPDAFEQLMESLVRPRSLN